MSMRTVHTPTARPLTLRRGGRSSAVRPSSDGCSRGPSPGSGRSSWAGLFNTRPSLDVLSGPVGGAGTLRKVGCRGGWGRLRVHGVPDVGGVRRSVERGPARAAWRVSGKTPGSGILLESPQRRCRAAPVETFPTPTMTFSRSCCRCRCRSRPLTPWALLAVVVLRSADREDVQWFLRRVRLTYRPTFTSRPPAASSARSEELGVSPPGIPMGVVRPGDALVPVPEEWPVTGPRSPRADDSSAFCQGTSAHLRTDVDRRTK